MRRICGIVLVFCLFYYYFGYFIAISIDQAIVAEKTRENILPKLRPDLLVLIKSAPGNDGVVWIEKNKEFIYNGTMYDVVKTGIVHDTAFYYCYTDKKETRIAAAMKKLLHENSTHDKSRTLAKKIAIQFFFQEEDASNAPAFPFVLISIPGSLFRSVPADIHSPPPKYFTA